MYIAKGEIRFYGAGNIAKCLHFKLSLLPRDSSLSFVLGFVVAAITSQRALVQRVLLIYASPIELT